MPDSVKISGIDTKDEMEMIKEDTEEFLSLLSDSDASTSSTESPGISPSHSSLTLEQFTNIVLAKEEFDTFNSVGDIPVSVDKTVDVTSSPSKASKQVILPKTLSSHSHSSIQQSRSTAGEKLKPVVLTPRQVHVRAVPSPIIPSTRKPGQKAFKLTPNSKPSQLHKHHKSKTANILPLYESIFSLAGSPGAQRHSLNVLAEKQQIGILPDQSINNQIRKQLESVIKRNEDILRNTDLLKQDVPRSKDKTCHSDNSSPMKLSVRKDLIKGYINSDSEQEKKNTWGDKRSSAGDLSQTVASLMTKAGGDLEITRKVKQAWPSQRFLINDKLALVNMTPIYRPRGRDESVSTSKIQDKMIAKRKAYCQEDRENVKKKKHMNHENIMEESFAINSTKIKQETSALVDKIDVDCKLALQPDLHGYFPLHNAVLLSNINLVKRFSLVLAALQKSVDLLSADGMTPLHLAVRQNNPGIVEELLHRGASPCASTPYGDTCYHLAVRHGDGQSLGVILKHGPDREEVNLLNDQGLTALHLALVSGKELLLKMLLAYGAKPDIQECRSGKTGLLLALEQGNQSLAELLICYGASMSSQSWGGVTPASCCSENRKQSEQLI